jgi:hypothetical protein
MSEPCYGLIPCGGCKYCSDPYNRLIEFARDDPAAAVDRIETLEAWKDEALRALSQWDEVWVAAGKPGPLGTPKAEGVRLRIGALEEALGNILYAEEEEINCRCHLTEGMGNEFGAYGSCRRCDIHIAAQEVLRG